MPAFATLLPDASRQVLGNCGPLERAVVFHQHENFPIFFLSPGPLDNLLLLATLELLLFSLLNTTGLTHESSNLLNLGTKRLLQDFRRRILPCPQSLRRRKLPLLPSLPCSTNSRRLSPLPPTAKCHLMGKRVLPQIQPRGARYRFFGRTLGCSPCSL